jgi:hypothetical protein
MWQPGSKPQSVKFASVPGPLELGQVGSVSPIRSMVPKDDKQPELTKSVHLLLLSYDSGVVGTDAATQ